MILVSRVLAWNRSVDIVVVCYVSKNAMQRKTESNVDLWWRGPDGRLSIVDRIVDCLVGPDHNHISYFVRAFLLLPKNQAPHIWVPEVSQVAYMFQTRLASQTHYPITKGYLYRTVLEDTTRRSSVRHLFQLINGPLQSVL